MIVSTTTNHLLSIRQGDDYKIDFRLKNSADITGMRFFLTLKKSFDDSDSDAVLQHLHIAGEGIDDDAENGYCRIIVPAEKTTEIPAGKYFYDFQMTSAFGEVFTILPKPEEYKVRLQVIPQVTRAN